MKYHATIALNDDARNSLPDDLPALMPAQGSVDFGEYLHELGLTFSTDGHYYSVGPGAVIGDRIILISGVISQLPGLIGNLLPYLVGQGVAFSMVKNGSVAKDVLNGNFGYHHIGKLIIVYLPATCEKEPLIRTLVDLTYGYAGPAIPGHLQIGGLVYMKDAKKAGEKRNSDRQFLNLGNKYLVSSALKSDAKGNVYKAWYVKGFLRFGKCVIKQGKRHMWSDELGRDMGHRLEWQLKLHRMLHDVVNVPKALDFFKENGDTYLVLEYIEGDRLSEVITAIYCAGGWQELTPGMQVRLMEIALKVFGMVEKIHAQGIVHRDLTSANFILRKDLQIYMMDFELSYQLGQEYPAPAFGLGTAGFMSSEQYRGEQPTINEDIFALGGFMIMLFTGIAPSKYDLADKDRLFNSLYQATAELQLCQLILKCLSHDPAQRPPLGKIIELLRLKLAELIAGAEFGKSHQAKAVTD